jgi:hypothetical protein
MTNGIRVALAVVLSFSMMASLAHAQLTRTWVSGVGDDANPCSRTAPCKTFPGAISKTAANGEISVLDNGSFGTVTITKPMTINGDGNLASILASGGLNGIIINITDISNGSRVIIRNLSINGGGVTKGLNGIRVINGANVLVDRVTIQTFTNAGLLVENGQVVLKDSVVTFVKSATPGLGIGVRAIGSSQVSIENSMITFNNVGIQAEASSKISIANNGFYNMPTAFACTTGVIESAGNNRKGNITGGATPECAPAVAMVVQ